AIAAFRDQRAVTDLGEIGEQSLVVLVKDLGAGRNLEHDVGAARPGTVAPHAVSAALGLEMLLVAVIDQRIESVDAERNDVAAASAIAAVRPAELDELLAPKRHAAVPAGAGADVDLRLVEKFHDPRDNRVAPNADAGAGPRARRTMNSELWEGRA